jgi:N-acetyl-alpha-D-muramate 1-phosphate uridylyltransferase
MSLHKAMIFAAGLGTRLKPITNSVPKAMVEVAGKPLLEILIERLIAAGIREVVINVHYLPFVITDFINKKGDFGIVIHISDESEELLETGGGLWKARRYFENGDPFLVANADVLTDIDIRLFAEAHKSRGGLATLAVRDRPGKRRLWFGQDMKLLGRFPEHGAEEGLGLAFSGYHIIDPRIFSMPTRSGKFSITDWYLDLCNNEAIYAYRHDEDYWLDIGSPEKLELANQSWPPNLSTPPID